MASAVVKTRFGEIRGVEEDGVKIFRGIPFAAPPTGELRFRAPLPPATWSGVRDASAFAPTAPQSQRDMQLVRSAVQEERSEDCLYLNVYTPGSDDAARPVMVWIHGGGFQTGSGSGALYDGGPLARRGDLVVVTINYRLGALGFMDLASLGGEAIGAVSNAGIRDQIAALEWVRDNIEGFGGDPHSVTIFGESAGGMSVGTLLGAPRARGLFHRAIAQSGAAHHVHTPDDAARVAEVLLSELGVAKDDLARLRTVAADDFVAAQVRSLPRLRAVARLGLAFTPVVDGDVLPRTPLEAVRSGLARDVALMIGTTRDKWHLFRMMDPRSADLDEDALLQRVASRIGGGDPAARARHIADVYRRAHGDDVSASDLFSAIETDRMFRIPAIRLAEAQREHAEQVFKYLFTWESPMAGGRLGACHALELPFVFGRLDLPGISRFFGGGPEAEDLSERMMDAWLAFARTGNPAHPGLPDWPVYAPQDRATLVLGPETKLAHAPGEAERLAWEGLL